MTDPDISITEDELHAYVDNELPAERRGDVEAWLAAHPDDAERVQSWRAMADALHARYDSVADEAVPKRLEIERLVGQARTLGDWGVAADPVGIHRRRWGRLAGAWRGDFAVGVPDSDRGCAGRAPAVRGRSPPSRRGARQRARASAAMADQTLRLDRR